MSFPKFGEGYEFYDPMQVKPSPKCVDFFCQKLKEGEIYDRA